jgi:hypothetical protein
MAKFFFLCPEVVGGGLLGVDLDGNSLDDPKPGIFQSTQFIGVI